MLSSKLLSCPFSVPRTQHEDMRCDSSCISISRRAREPRPHRVSFRRSALGSKNVHFYLSSSRCCCYLRTKHTETATVANFSWINSWEKKCNFEADLPTKYRLFLDLDEAHTMSTKWESEQKRISSPPQAAHTTYSTHQNCPRSFKKCVCGSLPQGFDSPGLGSSKASSFPKAPWVILRYVQGSKATAQKKRKKRKKSAPSLFGFVTHVQHQVLGWCRSKKWGFLSEALWRYTTRFPAHVYAWCIIYQWLITANHSRLVQNAAGNPEACLAQYGW